METIAEGWRTSVHSTRSLMTLLADVTVTGLPALLIILLILVLLIAGAVTVVRATARGAKKVAHGVERRDAPRES